jgi:hypothetical protein
MPCRNFKWTWHADEKLYQLQFLHAVGEEVEGHALAKHDLLRKPLHFPSSGQKKRHPAPNTECLDFFTVYIIVDLPYRFK